MMSIWGKGGHWRPAKTLDARDRPKQILLVSAVAKTVAKTRDTYTAITEPQAEFPSLVSAETVSKTEAQKQISHCVFTAAQVNQ